MSWLVIMMTPNNYYIKLLNSDKKALPKVVNRCQLFDLNHSVPPSIGSSTAADGLASVLSFLHTNRSNSGLTSNLDLNSSVNFDGTTGTSSHHYNTRAKHKATTASRHSGGGNNCYLFLRFIFYKVRE